MNKVQLEVLKPWIAQRITELLGIEDDVVVSLAVNYLESTVCSSKAVCSRIMSHARFGAGQEPGPARPPDQFDRIPGSTRPHLREGAVANACQCLRLSRGNPGRVVEEVPRRSYRSLPPWTRALNLLYQSRRAAAAAAAAAEADADRAPPLDQEGREVPSRQEQQPQARRSRSRSRSQSRVRTSLFLFTIPPNNMCISLLWCSCRSLPGTRVAVSAAAAAVTRRDVNQRSPGDARDPVLTTVVVAIAPDAHVARRAIVAPNAQEVRHVTVVAPNAQGVRRVTVVPPNAQGVRHVTVVRPGAQGARRVAVTERVIVSVVAVPRPVPAPDAVSASTPTPRR